LIAILWVFSEIG